MPQQDTRDDWDPWIPRSQSEAERYDNDGFWLERYEYEMRKIDEQIRERGELVDSPEG